MESEAYLPAERPTRRRRRQWSRRSTCPLKDPRGGPIEKEDPAAMEFLADEALEAGSKPFVDAADAAALEDADLANLILELSARLRLLESGTAAAQPNSLYVSLSLKPSSMIRPNSLSIDKVVYKYEHGHGVRDVRDVRVRPWSLVPGGI